MELKDKSSEAEYTGMELKDKNSRTEYTGEDFSLYTERIVVNPRVKYKKLFSLLKLMLAAVLFGAVACGVMVILYPFLDRRINGESQPQSSLIMKKDEYLIDYDSSEDILERPVQTEEAAAEVKSLSEVVENARKCMVVLEGVYMADEEQPYEDGEREDVAGLIVGELEDYYVILTDEKLMRMTGGGCAVKFGESAVGQAYLIGSDSYSGLSLLRAEKNSISSSEDFDVSIAVLDNSYIVEEQDEVVAVGRISGSMDEIRYGNVSAITTESSVDNSFEIFETGIVSSAGDYCYFFNMAGNVIGIGRPSEDLQHMEVLGISDLKPMIEILSSSSDIVYLGIRGTNVTTSTAERYKLPMGIYITDVIMDSPAFYAGLQSGDVITQFNGNTVLTIQEFSEKLYQCSNGENITVTVKRAGRDEYRELTFSVVLAVRQSSVPGER